MADDFGTSLTVFRIGGMDKERKDVKYVQSSCPRH
jgi:hypothetical protein